MGASTSGTTATPLLNATASRTSDESSSSSRATSTGRSCSMSAIPDRDDELLGRVRVGEADDLHVDEAGLLAGVHHLALGDFGAAFPADDPDGAVSFDVLLELHE